MTKLTYSQLEGAWIAGGGSQQIAPLMAAIALAESGGDPAALNPNDNNGTQSSYGLWQISTGDHTPPSPNWADPVTNARLAVGKLNSQGLGAWGTYTSGAYKAFMSNGVAPSVVNGTGTQAASDAFGPSVSAKLDPTCLIGIPGVSTGLNLGLFTLGGPGTPSICFVSKRMARQLVGGSLIAAGLLGGVVALAVIYGKSSSVKSAASATWRGASTGVGPGLTRGAAPAVPAVPVEAPEPSKPQDDTAAELARLRDRGNKLAPRTDARKALSLGELPEALAAT